MAQNDRDMSRQEDRLEEILFSSVDPVSKTQQLIRLGFDSEMADELVERHQMGASMPVYYETLARDDREDDTNARPSKRTK